MGRSRRRLKGNGAAPDQGDEHRVTARETNKRVVIITGASSGIGAATALRLARSGWHIVVNFATSAAGAESTVEACRTAGGHAAAMQADVSNNDECLALVHRTLAKWSRLDALVNNAGTTETVKHADLDGLNGDDFLRIYRTNVVAAFQMSKACATALRDSGNGAIVNVSSIASFLGTGSSIAYAASKAALNSVTLSLARVLGPEIRVNAVLPGYVETPWVRRGYGEAGAQAVAERYKANSPLARVSTPDDIADPIAWLVEHARNVTGEIMFVDGGSRLATPR